MAIDELVRLQTNLNSIDNEVRGRESGGVWGGVHPPNK